MCKSVGRAVLTNQQLTGDDVTARTHNIFDDSSFDAARPSVRAVVQQSFIIVTTGCQLRTVLTATKT